MNKLEILKIAVLLVLMLPLLGMDGCQMFYQIITPNDSSTQHVVKFHGTIYMVQHIKEEDNSKTAIVRVFRWRSPDETWIPVTDKTVTKVIDGLDEAVYGGRTSDSSGIASPAELAHRFKLTPFAATLPAPKVYVLDTVNLFQFDPTAVDVSRALDLTAGQPGAPSRMAITSDGAFAVISNINRPNRPYVLIVNLATFSIAATIQIPENAAAYGVAITPDDKFAYIVTESLATVQNSVYVIDLIARTIATTIPLPKYQGLTNIVMTPDGAEAYLNSCCGTNFQIPVIDIFTNTVAMDVPTYYYSKATNIVLLDAPAYMAMHPDGSRVYLAPIDGTPIHVLDTASKVVTKRIEIPKGPASQAGTKPVFTPDGRFLFVLDGPAAISVIDTSNDTLQSTIPLNPDFASQPPGSAKLTYFFVPDP